MVEKKTSCHPRSQHQQQRQQAAAVTEPQLKRRGYLSGVVLTEGKWRLLVGTTIMVEGL